MNTSLKVKLNENLYIRNPEDTELGKKIIASAIKMIDELGFECFTFKKLATEIESTEASIYRYFENKHKLLVYIISWYWVWLDYNIYFHTFNIENPVERLKIIIKLIVDNISVGNNMLDYDINALNRITICEASKVYLTKEVDHLNKEGLFRDYKVLCNRIANIILEINPQYCYPHSLVSMVIEAAHYQAFFAEHLPSLTEIKFKNADKKMIIDFLDHILFSAIAKK